MKVSEIMSKNVVVCRTSDTAVLCAKLMKDHDVGAIPVVDDPKTRRLLGIITDRDIAVKIVAAELDPRKTTIERAITPSPATARADDDVERVAELMREKRVRRVPVTDTSGALVGIVAQGDIARKGVSSEKVHETVKEISKPSKEAA
jgi:CBS domain-containing protein